MNENVDVMKTKPKRNLTWNGPKDHHFWAYFDLTLTLTVSGMIQQTQLTNWLFSECLGQGGMILISDLGPVNNVYL